MTVDGDDNDNGWMAITMMAVTMITTAMMMMAMALNVQTACRLGLVQISPVNISHLSTFFEQIVQFSSDDSDTEPQHAFLALRFGTSDELVCIFVVLYFKLVYFCKSYKFGPSKNYLRFIHLDLCKNIPFLDPELFPQKSHV